MSGQANTAEKLLNTSEVTKAEVTKIDPEQGLSPRFWQLRSEQLKKRHDQLAIQLQQQESRLHQARASQEALHGKALIYRRALEKVMSADDLAKVDGIATTTHDNIRNKILAKLDPQ